MERPDVDLTASIGTMKTPYVPHLFGADALEKARSRLGWTTVGVASSIPWPQDDVWIEYDSCEFLLHGVRREGEINIAPCISTPASNEQVDDALARLYRLTSILGYFKRGFVDITGRTWSSRIIRFSTRDAHTSVVSGGERTFNCNHMPVVVDDQVRRALAFLREGRRLEHLHAPYAFLSYFKVLESQFASPGERIGWIQSSLDHLDEERAVKRVNELRSAGLDVSDHLYESGRCAVAHANVGRNIVDPDVPSDRKRIEADLDVIGALANRYIKVNAGVPDEMDLYKSRDRVAPWHPLMTEEAVAALKTGGNVERIEQLGRLGGATVSVRLWPDPPAKQFEAMTLLPTESGDGVLKFMALSSRGTIVLAFAMDMARGRLHTLLNEGGLRRGVEITEEDVEDYTRYFHSVIGNRQVELSIAGEEPVDCEVVIPVNIIPRAPEEAVAQALEQFRRSRGN